MSGFSILIIFIYNHDYFVYLRVEFIFSIYSYLLHTNTGIYQKSYNFI